VVLGEIDNYIVEVVGLLWDEDLVMPYRFLPDSSHSCGFLWIPEELNLAETPSQNYYSGGYKFQWNEFIPELAPECSPEFTGTECHRNPVPGVFIH
jgi:hypothetical protein